MIFYEKSTVVQVAFPLPVRYCFSFTALKNFSLSSVFSNLTICINIDFFASLGLSCLGLAQLLESLSYIFCQILEVLVIVFE